MKQFKEKIIFIVFLVIVGAVLFVARGNFQYQNLPPVQSYQPKPSTTVSKTFNPTSSALLAEINLAIPFTSQAPYQNWDQPYQDFCEEASVLMAVQYVKSQGIPSPAFADEQMKAILDFEMKTFSYYRDTNAGETATIIREFYKISAVKVIYNPTVDDIKKALVARKAVIVPAAGRLLGNPYFTAPGPLYHMLVIKGYTKDGNFITNDPGTRHGADYIYKQSVIMNAMHDWNGGDPINGRKVIIVVG